MQHFDIISGKVKYSYEYPESLNEIPLSRLIKYQTDIESQKPQSLFDVERKPMTDTERAAFVQEQGKEQKKLWFDFYCTQVAYWCNMPIEHAKAIKINDLLKLRNMLTEMLSNFNYDPDFKEFEFDGITYRLPDRYMTNSTVIEFIEGINYESMHNKSLEEVEAADKYAEYIGQLKNSQLKILPKIMALLCRRVENGKPVDYYDNIVEDNEKIMEGVSCNVALNVSFFLMSQKLSFIHNSKTLLTLLQLRSKNQEPQKLGGNMALMDS